MKEEGTRIVMSRRLTASFWPAIGVAFVALTSACSSDDSPSTPTSATPPATTAAAPTLAGVTLAGPQSFTARGTVAQFALTARYSDGSTSDESRSATWTSDNAAVATVSGQGLVTSQGDGDATISAVLSGQRATRSVSVRIPAAP